MRAPDLALRARTSVAAARVGLLTTYARHPAGQTTTTVAVSSRPDGTLDVQLARDAVGVRQLLARPAATLELHPVGCEPVLLQGSARRLPGMAGNGALLFHLEVAAVRVGTSSVLLDQRQYAAATPGPLARQAPAVLEHVNSAHEPALAACLRALGHRAHFVQATGLDGGGLDVAAVTEDGVEVVRLLFPRPITELAQLPTSLALALHPRCGCTSRSARSDGEGHTSSP